MAELLPLDQVCELREARLKEANELLQEGWTLLAIQSGAGSAHHGDQDKNFYVRRLPIYVFGLPRRSQAPPPAEAGEPTQ